MEKITLQGRITAHVRGATGILSGVRVPNAKYPNLTLDDSDDPHFYVAGSIPIGSDVKITVESE